MPRYELTRYEYTSRTSGLLTAREVGDIVGLHADLVIRFYDLGLIDAQVDRPRLLFDVDVLPRIELALRLRDDLGIGTASCGLILDLLERIEELERRLHHCENR
jgi:hypothetical protein